MDLRSINPELERLLQIRYIKLHFKVQFVEDGQLPEHKTSAIRGGMGEMLLRSNCVRNRDCENCDFEEECIVQRTMYSKMKEKAAFMTNGDSLGYVLECEDKRQEFETGDMMEFQLILFGRTIVYFNQYLQALHMLGMNGLGRDNLRYQIISVSNSRHEEIIDDNNVYMKYYQIETVADYVNRRLYKRNVDSTDCKLIFYAPLCVKYQGSELDEFKIEGISAALKRKIYMFDLYEGLEDAESYYREDIELPDVINSQAYTVRVPRYSFRKSKKMYLKGIRGVMQLDNVSPEFLAILYAGELLHIGKHNSFGFGHYRVSMSR